jgi:hypothetical protein
MILSREIIIGEEHMVAGARLVVGVDGFHPAENTLALYEGKLFMPGVRFRTTEAAEMIMNMDEDSELQSKGDKALGFHIDKLTSGVFRRPIADFSSFAVWREVMLLPEEVWQRLEDLNV